MSIFGSEVDKKVEAMGGTWIKAEEFKGEGLTLRFDSVEKICSYLINTLNIF